MGECQEESKLLPVDVESYDYFWYDVGISGYTAIIVSPLDDYMGSESEYIYILLDRTLEHGRR